jgi:type I restriction enzyme, S subunit
MSEWSAKRLGEVCEELTVGHVGSMASQYVDGGIPFLRSQNVRKGRLDLDGLKYISVEFHQQLRKSRLLPGDIVMVRTGEPGAAALIPDDLGELNCADLVIARPNKDVDQRFLCYAINTTAERYIAAHLVGAVQQHFNVGSARNLEILLPPFPEQREISSILGALDDKIAVNDRVAETTRTLARAHFRVAQESADPDDIDLASIVEFLNRGVAPRYTEDQSQLRVLNQKCVRDSRVNLAPSRWTITDKVPNGKVLRPHDVLVNSTGIGTLGRVARWTRYEACTVDSHVTIVRFDPAKVDPVCAGFAMLDAEPEIESLGQGSTGQTELGRAQLSGIRITVPSRESSAKLRPTLDALESRGDSALEESLSLAQLRDALLPRLISGEIRVRDAEKVVEDVT